MLSESAPSRVSATVHPPHAYLPALDGADYVRCIVVKISGMSKERWEETQTSPGLSLKDPSDSESPTQRSTCYYLVPRNLNHPSIYLRRLINQNKEPTNLPVDLDRAINPEAFARYVEFTNKFKDWSFDKIFPKPLLRPLLEELSVLIEARDWINSIIDFNAMDNNWLLLRMVEAAEKLSDKQFSIIVEAMLGECLRRIITTGNLLVLRKFFHERHPTGGFTSEEENRLLLSARIAHPLYSRLFNTGPSTGSARSADLPNAREDVVMGVQDRQQNSATLNWILHEALNYATKDKVIEAFVDLASIDIYNVRHLQRAQSCIKRANLDKISAKPKDTILKNLKKARLELLKISPELVLCQVSLAEVYFTLAAEISLDDLRDFKKFYDEARKAWRKLTAFGEIEKIYTDLMARALNNIGETCERLGDISSALLCKQNSLSIFQYLYKNEPNGHVNVAAVLFNVGSLLGRQGDLRSAIDFQRRGLNMLRSLSNGQDHERLATALSNLGVYVLDSGGIHEGIALLTASLEMRERLFGKNDSDHYTIGSSLNILGIYLVNFGDRVRGVQLLRRGLAMNERLHPSGHKNLADNLVNLASGLTHQNNSPALRQAQPLLERAVVMYGHLKTQHDVDDDNIAITLYKLADVKERLGDTDGAMTDFKRALEIREAFYQGSDVAPIASSMFRVGNLLVKQDGAHRNEGLIMMRDALIMFEKIRHYGLDFILAFSEFLPYWGQVQGQLPQTDWDRIECRLPSIVKMLPMLKREQEFVPPWMSIRLSRQFLRFLEKDLPRAARFFRLRIQDDASKCDSEFSHVEEVPLSISAEDSSDPRYQPDPVSVLKESLDVLLPSIKKIPPEAPPKVAGASELSRSIQRLFHSESGGEITLVHNRTSFSR
jgi:tetratricopeptide (TPR) repeat protein